MANGTTASGYLPACTSAQTTFFIKSSGESRSSRFPLFAHKVLHKGKFPRKPHKHRTSFALSVENRTGDKADIADGTLGADRRDPAGGTHADAGASLSLLYWCWCWCWCVALASKPWVTEASVASCLGSAAARRHPTCSGDATNGHFRAGYRRALHPPLYIASLARVLAIETAFPCALQPRTQEIEVSMAFLP